MKIIITKLFATAVMLLLCSATFAEIDAGDQQPVPDLRWMNGQGEQHHLYGIKDKSKLLHFWAAWCIPCREEMLS